MAESLQSFPTARGRSSCLPCLECTNHQATKNVDVIYKRLQIVAQTKPAGKGKKTVDQHLTNRIKGTKPLRDGLNEKMRDMAAQLDERIVGDESAVWADVGKGFFEVRRP